MKALKGFLRAILPLLVFYAVSLPALYILNYFFGSARDGGTYVILQGFSSAVTLPFLFLMYRKDRLQREAPPACAVKVKVLHFAYAAVTIGVLSIVANNFLGLLKVDELSAGWESAKVAFYGGSPVVEILFLGIIVPFVEEFLYRGVIYERFRDCFPAVPAIVMSALLFGIFHFNLAQFLYAFLMGLFLANFAERYHSFFPAFLGHATANCIAILRQETNLDANLATQTTVILTIGFAVAGIILFFLQYKIKALKE